MKNDQPNSQSGGEEQLHWNALKQQDYSGSFNEVEAFLRSRPSNVNRKTSYRRRLIRIAVLAMLPLLVFLSCKQNNYVQEQGATLSFTAHDSLLSRIDQIIQQYHDKDLRAVFKPSTGIMRAVITTSSRKYQMLKEMAEKLQAIPGINELYVSSVTTTVREPILSRVTYQLFNQHFNAVDLTDEELSLEFKQKLATVETGLLPLELTTTNGRKQLMFASTEKMRNFSVDLTLKDGSNIRAEASKW